MSDLACGSAWGEAFKAGWDAASRHNGWDYLVCGYQGHGLYLARSLREALDGIARDYARSEIKPKRTIMRRRKAGPWQTVALDGA